jgi:hypothetical protein
MAFVAQSADEFVIQITRGEQARHDSRKAAGAGSVCGPLPAIAGLAQRCPAAAGLTGCATKPFSEPDEAGLKQESALIATRSNNGVRSCWDTSSI